MENDKKTTKHILNILRQGTVTWHVRNLVLNRGRRARHVGEFKNGSLKYLWERKCDGPCGQWYLLKDSLLEVDHIEAVGTFNGNFDEYIKRMYCSPEKLQALCISCHAEKTAVDVASIRYKRKTKLHEEVAVEVLDSGTEEFGDEEYFLNFL